MGEDDPSWMGGEDAWALLAATLTLDNIDVVDKSESRKIHV